MNEIQLSIIIPIYNADKYLGYCLHSTSELPENIEIIMIDDGSNDTSSEICMNYCQKYSNYTYIHQENQGPATARNKGILKAKGKWITFVDADDWIIPQTYIHVLEKIDNTTDILYFSATTNFNKKISLSNNIKSGNLDILEIKKGLFNSDSSYIRRYINEGLMFHGPVAKFYKKDLIICNDIKFPENIYWGEDICFNYIILMYAKKIKFYTEMGYCYRINDQSIMNSYKPEKSSQMLSLMETIQKLMNTQDNEIKEEFYKMGIRQYLFAMKMDFCNKGNKLPYNIRKQAAKDLALKEPFRTCIQNGKLKNVNPKLFVMGVLVKKQAFGLINLLIKLIY